MPDFHLISRDTQNSLDKGFASVFRIPKNHNISPSNILKPVNKAIDEYPLLIYQPWLHACSLNLNRLDHKNHNENRYCKSKEDIAEPGFQLEHRFEFLSLFFCFDLGSALIVYCQMRFSPQFSASEKPKFKLPDGDAKLKWFMPHLIPDSGFQIPDRQAQIRRHSMRFNEYCGLGASPSDADTIQVVENDDVRKYFLRLQEVLIGIWIALGKMAQSQAVRARIQGCRRSIGSG